MPEVAEVAHNKPLKRKGHGTVAGAIDRARIDVGKALKMRIEKCMTYEEIGKQFNTSKQAVEQALKPFRVYINNPEVTQAFTSHKSSLLNVVEQEVIGCLLDRKALKKASINNLAYALTSVNNINRLEQGKATQNININSMVQHTQAGINEATEALRAIQERLEASTGSSEEDGSVINSNEFKELQPDLT